MCGDRALAGTRAGQLARRVKLAELGSAEGHIVPRQWLVHASARPPTTADDSTWWCSPCQTLPLAAMQGRTLGLLLARRKPAGVPRTNTPCTSEPRTRLFSAAPSTSVGPGHRSGWPPKWVATEVGGGIKTCATSGAPRVWVRRCPSIPQLQLRMSVAIAYARRTW